MGFRDGFHSLQGFRSNKKVEKHCPTLSFDGPGCINNTLINVLKKINAVR